MSPTQEQAVSRGLKAEDPFKIGHFRFRAVKLSGGCCRSNTLVFCRYTYRFVSLLLQHFSRYSAVRGVIPRGTLYCFTGVQRVRCPCLRNGLLPFQHGGLWSRTSHVCREPQRAVGLHPLSKWSAVSTYVDSTAAHTLARWEGGLPRVKDVLPGRGGLDRTTKPPEPTGRAACCPLRD